MRSAPVLGLLAGAAVVAGAAEVRLTALETERVPGHHLLYLPSGQYLRVAALGYPQVAADVLYLWSIQYYGNFQIEDRYEYVDYIYSDIITELDPHYFDPYWIGALILSIETGNVEKALALLDKGFRNNKDQWIFPYLAGWECAYSRQYDRAAEYFRAAAAVPSAPPDVQRLVAGMHQRSGDTRTALVEWTRIAREATDPGVRRVAETRARSLTIEVDLASLRGAIDRYRSSKGGVPNRLLELVQAGLIPSVPMTPDGEEYFYDRTTGEVSAGPARVLPP